MFEFKGVGTSPKVRGPVKLGSHLEQKLTPPRYLFTQLCALLVLVNRFLNKNCFRKKGKILRTIFVEK